MQAVNSLDSILKRKINFEFLILASIAFITFDIIFIQAVYFSFIFLFFILSYLPGKSENLKLYNFPVWILLLIWGVFQIFNSIHFSESIYYFIILIFIPFCIFIVITNIKLTKKFLEVFFRLFILSGVMLSFVSIAIFYSSGFDLKLRISSLWTHYNLYAAYIMIVFYFSIFFVIYAKSNRERFTYSIAAIINLMGLFLTQTRGVWLATTVGLLILILKKPKYLIPIFVIFVIFILIFYDTIMERVATVTGFGNDVSSLGRLQAWVASILLIKENLFIGYGYDAFRDLMNNVLPVYFVVVTHPHNTFLIILLELGLIGFILFFNFYFKSLYYIFKLKKLKNDPDLNKYIDSLQISFITLLIPFMFEPYFTILSVINFMLWIMISLVYNLRFNQID